MMAGENVAESKESEMEMRKPQKLNKKIHQKRSTNKRMLNLS